MKKTEIYENEGFERFYVEYGNKVFNTVYCMVGNQHDTEDIVQEIFVLAYAHRHDFKGKSHPATWLYRITMNAVKTHIKRNARRSAMTSELSDEELEAAALGKNGVESHYLRKELNLTVQRALMKLPLNFREAFVLGCIEGYSYREIADIVGVSIGTVESRLFRARDRLRKELSGTTFDRGV